MKKNWEKLGWLIIPKSLLRHDSRMGVREGVREERSKGGIEVSEGGGGDGSNVVIYEMSVMMDVMYDPCIVNDDHLLLCNV